MKFKIIIFSITIIFLVILTIFSVFYNKDLSLADLKSEYINKHSNFKILANGAKVHYRDQGQKNAPTIVLIHGGFGSLHN